MYRSKTDFYILVLCFATLLILFISSNHFLVHSLGFFKSFFLTYLTERERESTSRVEGGEEGQRGLS